MGTPDFAVPSLEILLKNGYSIPAVVTAPDKPRGRGQEISPTPIKSVALKRQIPVLQPEALKDSQFVSSIEALKPDLIVVVAFRILPKEVFTVPGLGSFNLHASLLPKYRGAAPINWAIIKGEKETGVTTFLLQEKVDTGNILLQARVPIAPEDDAGTIQDKLAAIGAEIVLHTVRLIEQGKAMPRKQDDSPASPAPKIKKEDCRIDWNQPAEKVHDFIRGLSPSPGAFTTHKGKVIKVYKSMVIEHKATGRSGQVRREREFLEVATGDRMLSILELKQEGRKRMTVSEFLRGYRFEVGDSFE